MRTPSVLGFSAEVGGSVPGLARNSDPGMFPRTAHRQPVVRRHLRGGMRDRALSSSAESPPPDMGSVSLPAPRLWGALFFSCSGRRGFKLGLRSSGGMSFTGIFEELLSPDTAMKSETCRAARVFRTADRHSGTAFLGGPGPHCVLATPEQPSGCPCAGGEDHRRRSSSPGPRPTSKATACL